MIMMMMTIMIMIMMMMTIKSSSSRVPVMTFMPMPRHHLLGLLQVEAYERELRELATHCKYVRLLR
jgi:hypothetical protein